MRWRRSLGAIAADDESAAVGASSAHRRVDGQRIGLVISVVVPVRGAPEMLERCLAALGRSTGRCSGSAEVRELIVVDDGSGEEDAGRIEAIARAAGARLLRQAPAGPGAARNRGAEAASSEIVFFVDADVEVHPETMGQMAAAFAEDAGLTGVFGAYDDQPSAGTLVSDYRNLLHHYVHWTSRRQASTFWAGCGALRRAPFLAAGGFDTAYERPSIEDVELGLRLTGSGERIELRPEIQGKHAKRWTLRSFLATDLFARAIPWTEMLFSRTDALPPDLNFGWERRLCVPLALLWWISLIFLWRLPWLGLGLALVSVVGLVMLNRGFLSFLAQKRGLGFAGMAFPLHLLHYTVSGLGLAGGAWRVWRRRDPWGLAAVLALGGLIVGWQVMSGTYAADFGGQPDEPSHFVNGVMVEQFLRHPTLRPMEFAEGYYLHYPKVAIGHWPPFLPLVEGLWLVIFGVSRTAALALQAALGWGLAVLVYALARQLAAVGPAIASALWLMVTAPFAAAMGCVMADAATAAFALAAAALFAQYLRTPGAALSLAFGTVASLALMTKGSACGLALLPFLAIVIARRFELLLRRDLWLAALPILVSAVPWYWWAAKFSSAGHRQVGLAVSEPDRWISTYGVRWLEFGWPLLILAVAGIVVLPKRNPLVATMGGLALSYVLGMFVVASLNEGRHILPGAAAAAVLTVGVWTRMRSTAWVAVLPVLFGAMVTLPRYPEARFRGVLPRSSETMMLTGTGLEEGAIVAAIAEREPEPRQIVLRSSRVLATSGFMGDHYRLLTPNEAEVRARLDELGVAYVLLTGHPGLPHEELLKQTTRAWQRQQFAGFAIARNPRPRQVREVSIEQGKLHRRIRVAH